MEKKALSVVLMVALLATSFLGLQARVDLFTALTAGVGGGGHEPCCDICTICGLSDPPYCPCTYVRHYCHPECKDGCACTFSIPPICVCTVIKNECNVCKTTGIEK